MGRRDFISGLHAALSLAQVLRDQGENFESREVLGPIDGSFTEAFDTADPKEAKALLLVQDFISALEARYGPTRYGPSGSARLSRHLCKWSDFYRPGSR
jgi:hypothetical protein